MSGNNSEGGNREDFSKWSAGDSQNSGDKVIKFEVQVGADGKPFWIHDGKRYDAPPGFDVKPKVESPAGTGLNMTRSNAAPVSVLSPEEKRAQNLENGLEDSLMKMFVEKKSPVATELITREVLRNLFSNNKDRLKNASDKEIITMVTDYLSLVLGGADLTMEGIPGKEMGYLRYKDAKKGVPQTVEVPLGKSKRKLLVEFTPLIMADRDNQNQTKIVKVLCEKVTIVE